MIVINTGLSRDEARAREQFYISMFTIENLKNARREIAVKNLPQFKQYVSATASLWKVDGLFRLAMLN